MSLLKQIDDRGAVLEWSPVASESNLVALGTKESSGIGFDDYGGELELHRMNFSDFQNTSTSVVGKISANSRFSSLAWSEMATNTASYPCGLIAGGMMDGNIHLWDPSKLASGDPDPLLASVDQHTGAIPGLQFNPHKDSSHLLASGGADCEVFVMSLERPDAPNVFIPAPPPNNAKHTADITKVAWNTQVVHILASAANNGSCFIWDLRQKKAWCEVRDPQGGSTSDVAWNPDQGLHVVTASGDDRNPVIKLYDLRSSTTLPLATLQGHTEGILSVSWCPNDSSLLMSCGKDNRTMMWDLFRCQPVFDLPSTGDNGMGGGMGSMSQEAVFGGLASSAGQRRYSVKWSPCLPAIVSACSFDRKVQVYSLSGARSKLGRAPKWLRKPVGATFGFGGKLVSFGNVGVNPTHDGKKVPGAYKLSVSQTVEDPELIASCDRFHTAIAHGGFKAFCESKVAMAETEKDRKVWDLMNVICFEQNAREALLAHLGFRAQEIAETAEKYIESKRGTAPAALSPPKNGAAFDGVMNSDGVSAESVFDAPTGGMDTLSLSSPPAPPVASPLVPPTTAKQKALADDMLKTVLAGEEAEKMIRQAMVVGNFQAAVECCLEAGLLAEALVLAQCGDQSLMIRTQEIFFERTKQKYPFLNILHSIIKSELHGLVMESDLREWQQTLAVLSTYGKSEEFPSMCEALAARLETEVGDKASATLCYMCAANVERTVGFWTQELAAANAALGHVDTKQLQLFVEKVVVFTQANPVNDLGPDCSAFFAEYAALLTSQGRFDVALGYLKGTSSAESVLIDRLYHAGNKPVGSRPPPFPFDKVTVTNKKAEDFAKVAQPQIQAGISMSAPAPAPAGPPALLPGWMEAVDPSSGRPYYYNQRTGATQWDAPLAPQPAPVPAPRPAPAPQQPVATPTPAVSSPRTGMGLGAAMTPGMGISPMGGGAIGGLSGRMGAAPMSMGPSGMTNGSPMGMPSGMGGPVPTNVPMGMQPAHPMGMQAGHPMGMQPASPQQVMSPAQMPVPTPAPAPAPAPAPEPTGPVVVDSEAINTLGALINQIAELVSAPAEKRQMALVHDAYVHLTRKTAAGEVAPQVMDKVELLAAHVANRQFPEALAVQTDLANTAWLQHKEWIKGMKYFIQIAAKK